MIKFSLCGVKFRIKFSFLLFAALIFYVKSTWEITDFFFVCLLHELGHALALHICGGKTSAVDFNALGVRIFPSRERLLPIRHEVIILACGPLMNIVAFIILLLMNCPDLALLNLSVAVFNFLPYSMLDGGSILRAISENSPLELPVKLLTYLLRAAVAALLLYGSCFINPKLILPTLFFAFLLGFDD